MRARRTAAAMREAKRIEEEHLRQEEMERERLAKEKEAADELSIEESLKYVYIFFYAALKGGRDMVVVAVRPSVIPCVRLSVLFFCPEHISETIIGVYT